MSSQVRLFCYCQKIRGSIPTGIFIAGLICTALAYLSGYMTAEHAARERLLEVVNSFNDILKISEDEYKDLLKNTRNMYETEIREISQRNTKLLNEISHATGVDEINLPSFGTIYLDSEKHLREAMRLLNEED